MSKPFGFAVALEYLKADFAIRRAVWHEGAFIRVITFNGYNPVVVLYEDNNARTPGEWIQWEDMIATDWELVV